MAGRHPLESAVRRRPESSLARTMHRSLGKGTRFAHLREWVLVGGILGLLLASLGAVSVSSASWITSGAGDASTAVVAPAATDITFNGTLQGPQDQSSNPVIAAAPSGTVWDVVSAQVWVNDSQAAPAAMNSYIYTWLNPSITSWEPNFDTLANTYGSQGSEGSFSGAGGYAANAPADLTQYIQFDQTIQLTYAVQAVFSAQLPSGASASYVLVVAPESGSFPPVTPFQLSPGVTLPNGTSATIAPIPDSSPPAGSYYRVENAWASLWLGTPESPPMLAEVVEEPSGFVLCEITSWPSDDGLGFQVDATGGYSTAQTGISSGPGERGTETVWSSNVTVTSSQWLDAMFIGGSGDSGLYAVALTEYPAEGPTYSATFQESGLPTDKDWSVTMSGVRLSSATPSIAFTEPNGSYAFTIDEVSGCTASPSSGTLTVGGDSTREEIVFTSTTPASYPVIFTESGLPSGTEWWVNVTGGPTARSITNTNTIDESNGTYAYSLATANKRYTSTGGTFTIDGAGVPEPVTFGQITYTMTFAESGLPAGTSWSVIVNGDAQSSVTSTIGFTKDNGTYSYAIEPLTGYAASPASGTLVMQGDTTENIAFSSTPGVHVYSVTFDERGLPSGAPWSATLAGVLLNSTTTYASFGETNGTHTFYIGAPENYTAAPDSGNVVVFGSTIVLDVTFTENVTSSPSGPPASQGFLPPFAPAGLNWYVIGVVGVLAIWLIGMVDFFVLRLATGYPQVVRSLARARTHRARQT
ncbi:MAG: hypothetical protein WAN87_04630 [Thermoplasmata archaeon]